ncbi:MAG: 50S ribosomal protein L31 [bacterium]|nr:50S ribosomal protein L31 [bacterium]
MKTEIHPKYFDTATATCACGAIFAVGSTKEKIQVEICSQCHPFYTGTDKVLDTAGRVERFKTRAAAAKPRKLDKLNKVNKLNKEEKKEKTAKKVK